MSIALKPADYLHGSLPFRLMTAAEDVVRVQARDILEQFDLSLWKWQVLEAVAQQRVATPAMIVTLTAMNKVRVSRAAAALVNRGLLHQTKDPEEN